MGGFMNLLFDKSFLVTLFVGILAFATVVTRDPASNRLDAMFAMIRRWCAGSRPKRGPFLGVGIVTP